MASTGEVWKLGHRPALDGLRGVAALAVVASHVGAPGVPPWIGHMAVTSFFTLSGFLIASVLFDEQDRSGAIRLGKFYRRRALRLLPALFAVVAATCLVGVVARPGYVTGDQAVAALLYVSNWLFAAEGATGALVHTWSLSVEEQFYILFPVLLVVTARRRRLLGLLCGGGALAVLTWRASLLVGGATVDRVVVGSDTRADGLLVGVLLALLMRRTVERPASGWVSAVALAGAFSVSVWPQAHRLSYGLTVAAVLSAVAIWAAARGPGRTWLSTAWLAWVGRRSYGLYLWHMPVVIALYPMQSDAARVTAVLAVSLALTVLSWWYVEEPFLRMKRTGRSPSGGLDLHYSGATIGASVEQVARATRAG